jgi:hypothetical protein
MSTFLELTNKVLRRLNEVEISPSDFASVRGVQALAKDAVVTAIAKINQAEFTWPFNAAEHQQTLLVGQEEYSWPVFFKVADWDSFQIQKDESLEVNHKSLKFISRDQWYMNHRDQDYDAGVEGRDIPTYVFPAHGNGWGLSPSPDKPYDVKFRYYLSNVDMSAYNDESRIPTAYDHVILEGALYTMYMFRDNVESASAAAAVFQQGVKEMQSILINKYNRMYDTRIRF